jgi:hypothetical protein
MQMATESKTPVTDLVEQARGMLAVNPMVTPQVEQFWKAQESILGEVEAYSKAWFARRHDATRSALEVVQRSSGNGTDPAAALKAMTEWQQHSIQRLAADTQEWIELCTRCASHMTNAEMEAGKEGLEEVEKRAKATTPSKHSTPV